MDRFTGRKVHGSRPDGRKKIVKRKRSESAGNGNAEDDEGMFESQKEFMHDISYFSTAVDKFGWQKVSFDPKLFGKNADLSGLLSIETMAGDDADGFLKALGHDGDKAEKSGKKKAKRTQEAETADSMPESKQGAAKKGRKARHTEKKRLLAAALSEQTDSAHNDTERTVEHTHATSSAKATDQPAASQRTDLKSSAKEQKKARKLKQLRAKRLAKLATRLHEKQPSPDDQNGNEEEDEDAIAPLDTEESTDTTTQQQTSSNRRLEAEDPSTYDDEWEYGEWGGISMRKCLLKALEDLRFSDPTPIQRAVLPVAMAKRCDIFGAAETGSGKTLAFALPMLQRILDSHSFSGVAAQDRHLAALVLSPTRELAIQVRDHIAAAAKYTPIRVVGIIGGMAVQKQERLLAARPHIVVGTPGRLWEQMQHGDGYLTRLHMLLCLVIDEADRMLETGHFAELENILGVLPSVDPSKKRRRAANAGADGSSGLTDEEEDMAADDEPITTFRSDAAGAGGGEGGKGGEGAGGGASGEVRHYRRQTLVFSATLIKDVAWRKRPSAKERAAAKQKNKRKKGHVGDRGTGEEGKSKESLREESVRKLMERLDLPEPPVVLDLCPRGKVAEKVTQYRVTTVAEAKDEHVYHLLLRHQGVEGGGRALVFVNAVGECRRIAHTLSLLRLRALLLHSGLQQRQRLKNLETFRNDPTGILIATDVAARGLDIPAVELVVHYHVPRAPALYVHRCGRTARGRAESGVSVLLVSPQERTDYLKIADVLEQGEDDMPLYECSTSFFAAAGKRMAVAKKLEALTNQAEKKGRERGWLARQAKEMDIELEDEDLVDPDDAPGMDAESVQTARRIQDLRAQLDRLLDSDVVPRGVNPRFITAIPGTASLRPAAGGSSKGGAAPGLPELLRRDSAAGAAAPSAAPPVRGFAGGARVHRKKPMKAYKFGKRR